MRLDGFLGGGTRTGKDGRARIGPLPAGKLEAQVTAEGYAKKDDLELGEIGDEPVTIELTRGVVIAGRVELPAGMPLQGVAVTVATEWSGGSDRDWVHKRARVAADGSFRVDTLPDTGLYRVEAEAYWQESRYSAKLVTDGGDEDVALELNPRAKSESGETLSVRVVDHAGERVPSARIKLSSYKDGASGSSTRRLSGGQAVFESANTDWELWIEVWQVVGADRGATIHGPLRVGAQEIEVRLPRALSVEGVVVGPDRRGVRGVRVTAQAVHPCEHESYGEDHGVAITDAQGRFRVTGLGDLEYELDFTTPPDYAPVPDRKVRAGAKDVRVTLRAGVSATVTVLDYAGKPVPGARVGLREPTREARAGPTLSVPTVVPGDQQVDASGRTTFRGLDPDATYTVQVTPPNGRKDLKDRTLDGWAPRDETVTLERGYAIRGVVKDTRGEPVTECWVQYRPVGQDAWTGSHRTDEDGRFVVEGLARGRYELHPFVMGAMNAGPGGPGADRKGIVAVSAGATSVVLTVDLGAKLTVRVRDYPTVEERGALGRIRHIGGSGQAVLRAAKGHAQVSVQLDATGRARFQGLVPGEGYTLSILGLPGGRYVLVRGVKPSADEIEVEMQAGGSVRGTIVAPEGVSLHQVWVMVRNAEGMRDGTRTDPKTGTFEFRGLPEGSWTVSAAYWLDGKRYQGEARTRTGGEVEIQLVADR
jgi:hypothetical protein